MARQEQQQDLFSFSATPGDLARRMKRASARQKHRRVCEAVQGNPDGIPPQVCALFETLSLQIAKQGFKRSSADFVLHRIRWHFRIDRGDREFKCNDHWTSTLSRWFLGRHPELPEFFETRSRSSTEDQTPEA